MGGGPWIAKLKKCWNVILLINFYVQWRTTVFWIFWGCLLVGKNCIQNLWILNRREYKYLHINNITEWIQWLSTFNGCLLQDRIYNYLYRTYCDVTLNLRFSDLNVILKKICIHVPLVSVSNKRKELCWMYQMKCFGFVSVIEILKSIGQLKDTVFYYLKLEIFFLYFAGNYYLIVHCGMHTLANQSLV